jgi:hypothetical protein
MQKTGFQTITWSNVLKMNMNYSMKSLDVVFCECGEEILIVPDLEKMIHLIQMHAEIHRLVELNKKKGKEEYERIEQQLTEKILVKISGLNYEMS